MPPLISYHQCKYLSTSRTSSQQLISIPGRSSNQSASKNDVVVPCSKLKLGEQAFSVAGPLAWNQLPTELKIEKDILPVPFKRKLTTFSQSYIHIRPLALTVGCKRASYLTLKWPLFSCKWQHRHCFYDLRVSIAPSIRQY